MFGIVKNTNAS